MIVFESEISFVHTTHTPLSVGNSSVSQRPDRLKHIVYSRETHFLFISLELEFKWTWARVPACTEDPQCSLQSLSQQQMTGRELRYSSVGVRKVITLLIAIINSVSENNLANLGNRVWLQLVMLWLATKILGISMHQHPENGTQQTGNHAAMAKGKPRVRAASQAACQTINFFFRSSCRYSSAFCFQIPHWAGGRPAGQVRGSRGDSPCSAQRGQSCCVTELFLQLLHIPRAAGHCRGERAQAPAGRYPESCHPPEQLPVQSTGNERGIQTFMWCCHSPNTHTEL